MVTVTSLLAVVLLTTLGPAQPGEGVRWTLFPVQKAVSEPAWGDYLADLEKHLPAKYKKDFQAPDLVVHAHETTHGINAHIRNLHAEPERRLNCFYVGGDRTALIEEPNIRLSHVAEMIPKSLRHARYDIYLIKQQKHWETEPLYLFDEWTAYVNGAQAGLEGVHKKTYKPDKTDLVYALMEFNVYAVYTVLAVKKYDKQYEDKQLMEYLAWNLRRSTALYHAGYRHAAFNWDDHDYLRTLRVSADALEFRQRLRAWYGAAWTKEVLGFE